MFSDNDFKKSTACAQCSHCVAVASKEDLVAIRNTKDLSKTTLQFSREEWQSFVIGAKNGEFDFF